MPAERKKWTMKEDQILIDLVKSWKEIQHCSWENISQKFIAKAESKRNWKQCRDRWKYQLDPLINKDLWSDQENQNLIKLHEEHGNQWSKISQHFQYRTDNQVRNRVYLLLKKGITQINSGLPKQRKEINLKRTIVNKLLCVLGKCANKYHQTNEELVQALASEIKSNLLKLGIKEKNEFNFEEKIQLKKKILEDLKKFGQNCKKKKQKRGQEIQANQILKKKKSSKEITKNKADKYHQNNQKFIAKLSQVRRTSLQNMNGKTQEMLNRFLERNPDSYNISHQKEEESAFYLDASENIQTI